MTQCLVDAKARLAKQGLTIPRLELVTAHMATNLVTKVKNVLEGSTYREYMGGLIAPELFNGFKETGNISCSSRTMWGRFKHNLCVVTHRDCGEPGGLSQLRGTGDRIDPPVECTHMAGEPREMAS